MTKNNIASIPFIISNNEKSFLVENIEYQNIFTDIRFRDKFEEAAYYLTGNKNIKLKNITNELDVYKNLKKFNLSEVLDDYKLKNSNIIKIGTDKIMTKFGEFEIELYEEIGQDRVHYFLHKGDFLNYPTRIHSGCVKSELFQSTSCDCRDELEKSLAKIQDDGAGSILYLNQEPNHLCLNTFFPEKYYDSGRDFHQACWIFKDMGFKHIKLITGNQKKLGILLKHGFTAEAVGFTDNTSLKTSLKK